MVYLRVLSAIGIGKDLKKNANQIHESLKYLHIENLSQRRKRQEETRVFFENTQIVYSDEEETIKYKEINPYKRRLKPKKGNLKPKKSRLHIIINIKY